jgi:peroxiredoxin Q/BCP
MAGSTIRKEMLMSVEQRAEGNVSVGDIAPDFTLPAHRGGMVNLRELLTTSAVVLYFYPKDNTTGCTAEACAFRDSYEGFKEMGADVVGVSSDAVGTHDRFAARHRLPFILLSDEGGVIRKLYGVPSTLGILPGRVTYVIDREGVVRHVFSSQFGATKHVQEALRIIQELSAAKP